MNRARAQLICELEHIFLPRRLWRFVEWLFSSSRFSPSFLLASFIVGRELDEWTGRVGELKEAMQKIVHEEGEELRAALGGVDERLGEELRKLKKRQKKIRGHLDRHEQLLHKLGSGMRTLSSSDGKGGRA